MLLQRPLFRAKAFESLVVSLPPCRLRSMPDRYSHQAESDVVYSAEQLIEIHECCTAVSTSLVETQKYHPLAHYRGEPHVIMLYSGRIAYDLTSLRLHTHVNDWISCGSYLPRFPTVSFSRTLWPHFPIV